MGLRKTDVVFDQHGAVIYVRATSDVSGKDVDDALLRSAGLVKAEERAVVPVPRISARCKTSNPYEAEICSQCGLPLTTQAAIRKDDELESRIAALEKVAED